jgi:hypothetical protein
MYFKIDVIQNFESIWTAWVQNYPGQPTYTVWFVQTKSTNFLCEIPRIYVVMLLRDLFRLQIVKQMHIRVHS